MLWGEDGWELVTVLPGASTRRRSPASGYGRAHSRNNLSPTLRREKAGLKRRPSGGSPAIFAPRQKQWARWE